MRIELDDVTRPEVVALLEEHLRDSRCGPFRDYVETTNNLFMHLGLDAGGRCPVWNREET